MRPMRVMLAAAMIAAVALAADDAKAQTLAECTLSELADPPRQVYDCGNGLLIEVEAGLVPDLPAGDVPGGLTIEEGAVLVDIPAGSGGFQIGTPHAIASVRGTLFVVDAGAAVTSVLVVEGEVHVARADGSDGVLLGPGEGIDVAEGEPLTPGDWSPERVAALFARFGR